MPIAIGAKQESGFDDPIGLLGDCHRRIERFLLILTTIAAQARDPRNHDQEGLAQDQRLALETALRYFREAAPRHTADEEESLFPSLHRTGALPPAITGQIAELEQDHEQATSYHRQVDRIGCLWLDEGELQAVDLEALTSALSALTQLYQEHIKLEETVVFPLAAQMLSDSDKSVIGEEMASRRGLRSGTISKAI